MKVNNAPVSLKSRPQDWSQNKPRLRPKVSFQRGCYWPGDNNVVFSRVEGEGSMLLVGGTTSTQIEFVRPSVYPIRQLAR